MKASTTYMYGLECLLFLIVIAGLFDFRAPVPDGVSGRELPPPIKKKLDGWNDARLKRFEDESNLDYAARMNRAVHASYYFCDYTARENLFERMATPFSKTWNEVGFLQPDRYCGFCHQKSYIVANILKRNGVDAAVLGINGHVVVLVKEGGAEYIFDPGSGVGPMPYQDNMIGHIPIFYGPYATNGWLLKPFATSKDDDYFYSMQWLNDAEKEQNRALYIVKAVYAVCVALFVFHTCFLLWNIFMTRRRRPHAPKTAPERAGAMPAAS